jgi:ribosomal silencing factor RsfS
VSQVCAIPHPQLATPQPSRCQDVTVLHVAPRVSWTSYMVFATVFSRPQLLAALTRIERMVAEEFPDRDRRNQPGASPWECLDYGDAVVHLFTAEQRCGA